MQYDQSARTFVELCLSPQAASDLTYEQLWMAFTRYSLQSKAFVGCICIFSNDTCAAPLGMAPFCDVPNVGYRYTYASPHILSITTLNPSWTSLTNNQISQLVPPGVV